MAKRKKNKILPLAIMTAVLAVLIAGYAVLSAYNAKKAEEEAAGVESSTVEVLKKSSAIPIAFSYDVKGETLAFSYDNEKWVYTDDPTFPVDSEEMTKMIAGMTDVKAVSVVGTDGADVAEFGLEKPSLTLKVKYSDGTDHTFSFGIINSFNGHRYMSVSGSDNIYMVEASLAEGFTKELKSLYEAEPWPLLSDAVASEDVFSIRIEGADGKTNTIQDENGIEKLFEHIYKLNTANWEDHFADQTEMKDTYGIYPDCDRVVLSYTKETTVTNEDGTTSKVSAPASYTLYFGHEFEIAGESETTAEGEEKIPQMKFFYTFNDSSVVYSKDKSIADDIFSYLTYVPIEETTTAE